MKRFFRTDAVDEVLRLLAEAKNQGFVKLINRGVVTVNEDGILNNYAPKVAVYTAEYPAVWEQRRYALQGAFATVFVGLMIMIAFSVSSLG